MKAQHGLFAVMAMTASVTLLALTINARQVSDESYENWLSLIREVSEGGTSLDAALLTSRINRRANYDYLSELSQALRETAKNIKLLSDQESRFLEPKLNLNGADLIDIIERHTQLVFDFQTELSTLNAASTVFLNSLREFVEKTESVSSGILTVSLMLLEEKLLITSRDGDEDKAAELNARLERFEAEFPNAISANQSLWLSIVDDSRSILFHTENLDQIVADEKQIRASEQKLIVDFFAQASEAYHQAARTEKILASLLVLELIIIALFFIARSRKLSQKVRSHADQLEAIVAERTESLELALKDLQHSSEEQEKMAEELRVAHRLEAIGQLAAGIAHEINTPTQFVGDNLNFLSEAFEDLGRLFKKYKQAIQSMAQPEHQSLLDDIQSLEDEVDIEFIEEEIPLAMSNSLDGVQRIAKIVKSMKDFSHPGSTGCQKVDLNQALETTLSVAKNEWKYVAEIEKDFDQQLPAVPAFASELNQVLLNIIVNSAHAIEKKQQDKASEALGTITLSTRALDEWVEICIKDNGCGIPREYLDRVFDPFFTTKEVGKGTGQGLSIARKIIVDQHSGKLQVDSEPGEYTEFRILLNREFDQTSADDMDLTKEQSLAKAS